MFVPSHTVPMDDITELAQYNIDKVLEVAEKIEGLCDTPMSFEQLLKKLFEEYELTMTFEQHALVGSTVRSYLTWLKDSGRISAKMDGNVLMFERIGEKHWT